MTAQKAREISICTGGRMGVQQVQLIQQLVDEANDCSQGFQCELL
jgi:hypothetical protein